MRGERIRQARELVGLTQQELAEHAGITQAALAQIEAGAYAPSDATLKEIAFRTGFSMSFLRKEEPPVEFPSGSILYRSLAKVSAKEKARAHRLAQLAFDLVLILKRHLKQIPVLLPKSTDDPVIAASLTRDSFGLSPDTPIPNIVTAIERAGVLILPIPLRVDGLDAFSAWVGSDQKIPVICILAGKVGFRHRRTLGEELGHLVMHSPLRVSIQQAESEAREFAGEFVLPEEAMRREMIPPITLASLAPLKIRWRVSFQFLVYRARELGFLSTNQYRYLMQQMSVKGWRTSEGEPGDLDIIQEQPRVLYKMAEVVYGDPPDWTRIHQDTGVPVRILKALLSPNGQVVDASAKVMAMGSSRLRFTS